MVGVDFAGKTGSAQTVSNAARKFLKGKEYNDNSWFVGVVPRRDPDIVVVCLFEGGEHGKLAARLVAQVVRSFVDKRRKVLNNVAYAAPPGYAPTHAKAEPSAEVSSGETPAKLKSAVDETTGSPSRLNDATQKSTVKPAAPAQKVVPKAGETPGGMARGRRKAIEIGGVMDGGDDGHRLGSGTFVVPPSTEKRARASAAPGMQ